MSLAERPLSPLSVRTSPPPPRGGDLEEQEILSHVKSIMSITHKLTVRASSPNAEAAPAARAASTQPYAVTTVRASSGAAAPPSLQCAPSALFCKTPRESHGAFSKAEPAALEGTLSGVPRQLSCKTPKHVLAVFPLLGNFKDREDAHKQPGAPPQPLKPFTGAPVHHLKSSPDYIGAGHGDGGHRLLGPIAIKPFAE